MSGVNEQDYREIIERLERLERATGLRQPLGILPNNWDTYGHYWGDWEDPYLPRYKEQDE